SWSGEEGCRRGGLRELPVLGFRPLVCIGTVAFVALGSLASAAGSPGALARSTSRSHPRILVSARRTARGALLLDGQTVAGEVYVSVTGRAARTATVVVDGRRVRIVQRLGSGLAPFRLDTRRFKDGSHRLLAKIVLGGHGHASAS